MIGEKKDTTAAGKAKSKGHFTAKDAKVLIVDDTEMNLIVIKGLLKRTGITVTTAQSGEEAIALVKEQDFDIIFLDHLMPEMDGIETLSRMCKETQIKNKGTPVICLTANAISGAREEYLACGFTDYLSKPVVPDELDELLLVYLPDKKVQLIDTEV